jgi:hypothetical protein
VGLPDVTSSACDSIVVFHFMMPCISYKTFKCAEDEGSSFLRNAGNQLQNTRRRRSEDHNQTFAAVTA